jgi:hypothetical protein
MHIKDATYLAISLGCNVHIDQDKYDGHESGQTRNGINLPKGADKMRDLGQATKPVITNPYRPAVGLIPSDGIPLKVKIDDELPARSRGPSYCC